MLPPSNDTIVAISSAVGSGARMIVRMSGADAVRIAGRLSDAKSDFAAGSAARLRLRVRDLPPFPGWVYAFRAPRSVTGEDVVEFHLPGNPLLARIILDACVEHGARPAEPGEFTARGYFSGRLDLAQAEGVAATIAAQSAAEFRAARQLRAGELARRLRPVMDQIADTLALVEAGIDFTEEDISFLSPDEARARIGHATNSLDGLLRDSARFDRLTHEPTVVLIGRPNAGKSTLLNRLAGEHRAVVSPIAGTTRDLLGADVALSGGVIKLIDAAGVDDDDERRSSGGPVDDIQRQMRDRALRAVESADLLVLVRDCTDARPALRFSGTRVTDLNVLTKSDLAAGTMSGLAVSAHTGAGMDDLRRELNRLCFAHAQSGTLALNARHVQLITDARAALRRAGEHLTDGAELLALELRESLDLLGSILGGVTPDDVLGRVFATFCVGK